MRKSSKPAAVSSSEHTVGQRHGGIATPRGAARYWRGKPSASATKSMDVTGTKQGRNDRGRNQRVKRLRKPAGAAQSGVEPRRRSLPPVLCVEGPPNPRKGAFVNVVACGSRVGPSRVRASEREDKGMRGRRRGITSVATPGWLDATQTSAACGVKVKVERAEPTTAPGPRVDTLKLRPTR